MLLTFPTEQFRRWIIVVLLCTRLLLKSDSARQLVWATLSPVRIDDKYFCILGLVKSTWCRKVRVSRTSSLCCLMPLAVSSCFCCFPKLLNPSLRERLVGHANNAEGEHNCLLLLLPPPLALLLFVKLSS